MVGWISIKEFRACQDTTYGVPSMEISACAVSMEMALYVSCWHDAQLYRVWAGVHNAKAEECTNPYMCQNIKINICMGAFNF